MATHQTLYDPEDHLDAELPLGREPHMLLVKAVLAWTGTGEAPRPQDRELIALQLAAHAALVATDVRSRYEQLPSDSEMRALTEVVLTEAGRRLSTPVQGTVASAQNRARLVRALYEHLDRLEAANPAAPAP